MEIQGYGTPDSFSEGVTMVTSDSGSESRDEVYSRTLTPKQAAVFRAAPGSTDLENEIKLLRTMISMLARDLGGHAPTILRGISVLCRIVEIQRRAGADTKELERLLMEVAEEALQGMQDHDVDPSPTVDTACRS